MFNYMLPDALQKLINSFAKLPGVGRNTAQRFSYFLLRSHQGLAREIGESLLSLNDKLTLCRECFLITDEELCAVCRNPRRDERLICVVENVFDAEAIERCGEFHGRYHVLHGRIAPLDRITPDDLKIKELALRVKRLAEQQCSEQSVQGNTIPEIIIATNPSSEGETTALYIQKILNSHAVKITRIATGIPVG
jgi:recombination protein RecR